MKIDIAMDQIKNTKYTKAETLLILFYEF